MCVCVFILESRGGAPQGEAVFLFSTVQWGVGLEAGSTTQRTGRARRQSSRPAVAFVLITQVAFQVGWLKEGTPERKGPPTRPHKSPCAAVPWAPGAVSTLGTLRCDS